MSEGVLESGRSKLVSVVGLLSSTNSLSFLAIDSSKSVVGICPVEPANSTLGVKAELLVFDVDGVGERANLFVAVKGVCFWLLPWAVGVGDRANLFLAANGV